MRGTTCTIQRRDTGHRRIYCGRGKGEDENKDIRLTRLDAYAADVKAKRPLQYIPHEADLT